MGIFKFFKQVKELDKVSTSYRNIQKLIKIHEVYGEQKHLLTAAWICRVGIYDIIEKNKWPSIYEVRVPSDNGYYKFTIAEIRFKASEMIIMESLEHSEELKQYIINILSKENAFYEVAEKIPQETKAQILNNKLI